jgi:signal peptidase II
MLYYLLILVAFLVDRLSKLWAASYLAEHGPTTFNALVTIRETYNRGVAFGLMQGVGRPVGWVTIAVLIGLLLYLRSLPPFMRVTRLGLALVIGGALGNLVDRVTTGQVLDFIQMPLRPGVFNGADVLIQLGLVLALIGTIRSGGAKDAGQRASQLDLPLRPQQLMDDAHER